MSDSSHRFVLMGTILPASGDGRWPMPPCAHGHRRSDGPQVDGPQAVMTHGPCRRVLVGAAAQTAHAVLLNCTSTTTERAVPTAVLGVRAAMPNGLCRRVLTGTVVLTAHAVLLNCMGATTEPFVPTAVSCIRASGDDRQPI